MERRRKIAAIWNRFQNFKFQMKKSPPANKMTPADRRAHSLSLFKRDTSVLIRRLYFRAAIIVLSSEN
jgi:hypothetical protein